jgi:hypothetical protein
MTQLPTSGRGPGEEPARDSGSPGGGLVTGWSVVGHHLPETTRRLAIASFR